MSYTDEDSIFNDAFYSALRLILSVWYTILKTRPEDQWNAQQEAEFRRQQSDTSAKADVVLEWLSAELRATIFIRINRRVRLFIPRVNPIMHIRLFRRKDGHYDVLPNEHVDDSLYACLLERTRTTKRKSMPSVDELRDIIDTIHADAQPSFLHRFLRSLHLNDGEHEIFHRLNVKMLVIVLACKKEIVVNTKTHKGSPFTALREEQAYTLKLAHMMVPSIDTIPETSILSGVGGGYDILDVYHDMNKDTYHHDVDSVIREQLRTGFLLSSPEDIHKVATLQKQQFKGTSKLNPLEFAKLFATKVENALSVKLSDEMQRIVTNYKNLLRQLGSHNEPDMQRAAKEINTFVKLIAFGKLRLVDLKTYTIQKYVASWSKIRYRLREFQAHVGSRIIETMKAKAPVSSALPRQGARKEINFDKLAKVAREYTDILDKVTRRNRQPMLANKVERIAQGRVLHQLQDSSTLSPRSITSHQSRHANRFQRDAAPPPFVESFLNDRPRVTAFNSRDIGRLDHALAMHLTGNSDSVRELLDEASTLRAQLRNSPSLPAPTRQRIQEALNNVKKFENTRTRIIQNTQFFNPMSIQMQAQHMATRPSLGDQVEYHNYEYDDEPDETFHEGNRIRVAGQNDRVRNRHHAGPLQQKGFGYVRNGKRVKSAFDRTFRRDAKVSRGGNDNDTERARIVSNIPSTKRKIGGEIIQNKRSKKRTSLA